MEDRKTLEQSAQMTDIERLRHSTAHVRTSCHVDRSGDISHYLSERATAEISGRMTAVEYLELGNLRHYYV